MEGLETARQIEVGFRHTCAIDARNDVWCWGDNRTGQVSGESLREPAPIRVAGLGNTTHLSLSDNGSCAIDGAGTLRCWGWIPGRGRRRSPTLIAGLPPVIAAAQTRSHACALDRTGSVWCWGRNHYGALGDGTTRTRQTPRRVDGVKDAIAVHVSLGRTCVVRATGTVSCWGTSWDAATPQCESVRGAPARACNITPTVIPGVKNVVELGLGTRHTCARRRDGTVLCWGPRTRRSTPP